MLKFSLSIFIIDTWW